jgi:methyltransferase (TIGR00027 family)
MTDVMTARSDGDSWDITESVGATALGMAGARARETAGITPLFADPYAQMFLDAAALRGYTPTVDAAGLAALRESDPRLAVRLQALTDYAACRTKYFDDFFVDASAEGVRQIVIVAAGLDSRAWRLPWLPDTVVYEIDQPKVLEFKIDTLRAANAEPAADYCSVPVDLRLDWPKALCEAGFDQARPAAWSVEGLLAYLPADAQDRLFTCIQDLSVSGSRVAVEASSTAPVDQRRTVMRQTRDAAAAAGNTSLHHLRALWINDSRVSLADWLTARGWQASTIEGEAMMARFGRAPAPEAEYATPHSAFVDGRRL